MHHKTESQREGGNPALASIVPINSSKDTKTTAELQARRISRIYAITYATAAAVAELAYAVGAP